MINKAAALLVFIILMLSISASAETRYVTDLNEITVRSGPGIEYRVLKTFRSGRAVETLDAQEGWSKISLGEDKTGWVISRFLKAEKPDSAKFQSLEKEIVPLRQNIENLQTENDRLIRMNQEMADELEKTRTSYEEMKSAYEALEEESKDYLQVKKESETLAAELEQKDERIADLENKLTHAYLTASIKWFLAGAGVLILGMLLGGRSKRERPGLR